MKALDGREPLYPDEGRLGRLILGERAREWPAKAVVLEREGLPKIDPLMGGRFWPAVRQWFCHRHGVVPMPTTDATMAARSRIKVIPFALDGESDFDGTQTQTALYQRRKRRPRGSGTADS